MAALDRLEIGLCWGTLQHATLIEMIEGAGRHGFPTLSIRPEMIAAHLDGDPGGRGLRRRLTDAGVRVRVIDALSRGLPGMPDFIEIGGRRVLRADEAECFRAAEAVGAPIVNVALFGGRATGADALVTALGETTARAEARGLRIALEFIPGTALPDIHAALAAVQAIGAPACSILLDSWHLARSGGAAEDVRTLPRGVIGGLQLSDRIPPPAGAPYVPMRGRSLPGEGRLPLHAIVAAALANSSGLTAEIEVFSEELQGLPVADALTRVAMAARLWRTRPDDGVAPAVG